MFLEIDPHQAQEFLRSRGYYVFNPTDVGMGLWADLAQNSTYIVPALAFAALCVGVKAWRIAQRLWRSLRGVREKVKRH